MLFRDATVCPIVVNNLRWLLLPQLSVILHGEPGDVFVCVDKLTEDTMKVCSLQHIKDLLKKRRLSVSGSKKELIRRLACFLGS